ncbi:putative ribonuclease H-like domain-containing protein [Tanacetum coccineum]
MESWFVLREGSQNVTTLNGLRGAETVNSTHLTHMFWPIIGDGGYNVGNTKEKYIRNPRIKLAHRCITITITGRKETTNRVTEIDLLYIYCIFGEGVVCNIPYWLAKYLKSVRDKSLIFRGMFVTRIARSFGLLTNEMVSVLNCEPPLHVYRKTSLVKMGVIMELHEGECCWPATRAVVEKGKGNGEEGDGEGGNEGVGGSANIYPNISQGDWQNVETASRFTRDAVTTTPVTRLYLTRKSLEVLRKFHWMILGGRFNQLSHVSSPLLSKPGKKVFNSETAKYGRIWYDEDVHDLRSIKTEFPAIIFNDNLTSNETLSCEPTISSLNDNEIDFRISFNESDDEDYTLVYDKNSFSYKIISINNLKTDSENDNEKVNMPLFSSPEPEVSYFNDLDFFKDFENEFPAIVYNDALTSKSDLLTEPTISPRHIDEFDLKDETSLSKCDEKEQNVLYFNDLLPFNVIYPNDLKSDRDNDNDKINIKQPSGDILKRKSMFVNTGFDDPGFLVGEYTKRGKIDKTLFIRRDKGDIMLVQVYVDDIIFGSTKKSLCTEFEKMMHKKFQMSSMGELTFFLGLQVKQKEDGIFISQDKYVTEILKKFGFIDVKTASTPMETQKLLLKDEDGEEVDVHLYRSMIGSLMYLTSSRPDIMFVVYACARYQVNPKVSHLHAVKRIFRYLKGQPKLGLWYPKDSPFDLVAYTDSDYVGASLDRKSTTGEAEYVAASSCCGQVLWIQNQLLDYGDCNEKKLIQMVKIHTDKNVADLLTKAFDTSCIEQFWATAKVKTVNRVVQLQALVDGKKIIVTEASIRRDVGKIDYNRLNTGSITMSLLEYIDNEVWKVIQNGNSKKRISIGKDGVVRVLSPVTAAEIQAVEKERKAKNILLMAIPKEHMRRFHGMDDAKERLEAIRTRLW